MAEENKNTSNTTKDSSGLTLVLSIVGGVIVGALAVWGWYALGTDRAAEGDITQVPSVSNSTNGLGEPIAPQAPSGPTSPTPNGSGTVSEPGSSVSLSIQNQGAGMQVAVAEVTLPYSGWVVIHEDANGSLGNALGAARVDIDRTPSSVTLLRGTVSGKTYHGLLYRDNGDRMFSLETDFPILDASGNSVVVRFETN